MFWESKNAISKIGKQARQYRLSRNFAQAKSLYTCLIAMIKKSPEEHADKLAANFYRLSETFKDEHNQTAAQTYMDRAVETWLARRPYDNSDLDAKEDAIKAMRELVEKEDRISDNDESKNVAADDFEAVVLEAGRRADR